MTTVAFFLTPILFDLTPVETTYREILTVPNNIVKKHKHTLYDTIIKEVPNIRGLIVDPRRNSISWFQMEGLSAVKIKEIINKL